MGWFGRAMGRFVHKDLSVEPDFDYYLTRAERKPLPRARSAVPLASRALAVGIVAVLSCVLLIAFVLKVELTLITSIPVSVVCALAALLVPWLRPGYRWRYHYAETLMPGMWVAVNMGDVVNDQERVVGSVHLTQILATFEHRGKEFGWIVGLHTGQQWVFKPDSEVPVFELVDAFAWARVPRPVEWQFEELELPVVGVLEALSEAGAMDVDDLVVDLANGVWSEETARRAVQAAWRLGMVDSDARGTQAALTAAGEVWLCAWSRERGVELVADAKEQPHVNINNDGILQFGNYNQAAQARDHSTATNVQRHQGLSAHELGALQQLLGVLARPAVHAQLDGDAREVVGDEVAAIADVVEGRAPLTSPVRKSIKTVLGIAGQLIIGAAGNGLYEALKQMVQ
ncbi:hypothetical protein ACIA5G_46120 [Amycolatopsis sp. NPDC051758]|uniref:hypothetical protein n=1 Tax=Amycolatopsis sp. NPDC051758 TaxID=3363935 RepID=UPI00379A064A